MEQQKVIKGRNFTVAVRPAHTQEQMTVILHELKGTAKALAITHDRDIKAETGELVEAHTHYLIMYNTPRNLSTVANLFNVDDNQIELVKSTVGMIRYLTHLDNDEKAQYAPFEVFTNTIETYEELAQMFEYSDRDIYEMIREDKMEELIGRVPAQRLKTIQQLHYYQSERGTKRKIELLTAQVANFSELVDNIYKEAKKALELGSAGAVMALKEIAVTIAKASETQKFNNRNINKR